MWLACMSEILVGVVCEGKRVSADGERKSGRRQYSLVAGVLDKPLEIKIQYVSTTSYIVVHIPLPDKTLGS